MGCCPDSVGCGFHYSGLPCPLESTAKRLNFPYTVSFDNILFESLRLSDQPARQFIRHVPPDCQLLALPGEIRNRIYRFTLVTAKPFAVQLQFNRPLDTALLRVNKQIFHEASGIFYAENTFRFPEALFVGAPILQQLHTLYRVPRQKLKLMRSVMLDVPVYGHESNLRFRLQTSFNLEHLTEFLASVPRMKVQLRLGYVFGEDSLGLPPPKYFETLAHGVAGLQLSGVEVDVHVKTHPRFLDEWVDLLTHEFQDRWSLEAMYQEHTTRQRQLTLITLIGFSKRYQMPGLREFYEETWAMTSYIFKPRRVPSSGTCAETIA